MKIQLRELSKRRDLRIPGFMFRHVYSEYWKSILRLFLFKDNRLYTFTHDGRIFFNIDRNTAGIINRIFKIEESDKKNWSRSKKNIINLVAIYFPFLIRFFIFKYREIIVTTDINLANYNIMELASEQVKTICVQHGYFPLDNKKDLDGLNSDEYIVRSVSQGRTLRAAGYVGDIQVIPFHRRSIEHTDIPVLIIFVGPGFGHSRLYENRVLEILKTIMKCTSYSVIYRPHPRCSTWLKEKLNCMGVEVDFTDKTQISLTERQFFVGVKSTMLIDAYEIGHEVLLVEDPKLPKYFFEGEFEKTVAVKDLSEIFK